MAGTEKRKAEPYVILPLELFKQGAPGSALNLFAQLWYLAWRSGGKASAFLHLETDTDTLLDVCGYLDRTANREHARKYLRKDLVRCERLKWLSFSVAKGSNKYKIIINDFRPLCDDYSDKLGINNIPVEAKLGINNIPVESQTGILKVPNRNAKSSGAGINNIPVENQQLSSNYAEAQRKNNVGMDHALKQVNDLTREKKEKIYKKEKDAAYTAIRDNMRALLKIAARDGITHSMDEVREVVGSEAAEIVLLIAREGWLKTLNQSSPQYLNYKVRTEFPDVYRRAREKWEQSQ